MFIKDNLRRYWGVLVFPIVYLLARVAVHSLYSAIVSFISVERVDPRRTVFPTDIMFILNTLFDEVEAMYWQIYNHGLVITLSAVIVLLIVFCAARRNKAINLKWMFFDGVTKTKGAILCAALGIAVGILQSSVIIGIRGQEITGSFLDMFNGSVGNAVFWIVAVVFFIPFAQEIVFRGIALYRALRLFSPLAAIIIQAALFALVTLDPLQGAFIFILGLVLGYIHWKTGSIWASFTVNAAHAITLILCYNLLVNAAGALAVIMAAASVAAGAAMVLLLYRQSKAEA